MKAHNNCKMSKDYSFAKESFICSECGRDFVNRDTLAMHVMETVRDGTCQKTAKSCTNSGASSPIHDCTPNKYASVEQKSNHICSERFIKKPRDTTRLARASLTPVLPTCPQSLFKTLINPLALPGWFRLQQASSIDPTRKDSPWCLNNCLYNNTNPNYHGHQRSDTVIDPVNLVKCKASDGEAFQPDANELRKRRVEQWKESVSRDRDMINILACKTLAMLNGQADLKLPTTLDRMLNGADYSKLGLEAIPVPTRCEASCSLESADNTNNNSSNRNDIMITGSRKPTPTACSKSDAMSSSWTGDSVLEFKASDSTEQTNKHSPSSSANSIESPSEIGFCFRRPRSKSTPPRLDCQTTVASPDKETEEEMVNVMTGRASYSHSERLPDSGIGSEPGAKLDVTLNVQKQPILNGRPEPRNSGSGRSILGKRTCRKRRRLRHSLYMINHIGPSNSSFLSSADSTACWTSGSSSSPVPTPAQKQIPLVKAQSRAGQTHRKACRTALSRMPSADSERHSKAGVLLPYFCSHCQIGFVQKTLFSLHMGLHCVDQPWKCNMCGQCCSEVYEFTSHTLHF